MNSNGDEEGRAEHWKEAKNVQWVSTVAHLQEVAADPIGIMKLIF